MLGIETEPIEELLELCWTAAEDGLMPLDRDQLPRALRCFQPSPISPEAASPQQTIDDMLQDGLLLADGRRIQLSPAGHLKAQAVVRRHRLTEVLLHNVLQVSDASVESTACQMEHLLNPEVTEAVCTFLGHPPLCPHGRQIPSDRCCEAATRMVEPLIVPLERVSIGEKGTVAFVHTTRHSYWQRLSTFGLAPGRVIHLRQRHPALVIRLGETELALDRQAGQEIFVRRARGV